MNRSLIDQGAGLMVVSQFTLYAIAARRRPSFTEAALRLKPRRFTITLVERARGRGIPSPAGLPGSYGCGTRHAGPVTIFLDSQNL